MGSSRARSGRTYVGEFGYTDAVEVLLLRQRRQLETCRQRCRRRRRSTVNERAEQRRLVGVRVRVARRAMALRMNSQSKTTGACLNCYYA